MGQLFFLVWPELRNILGKNLLKIYPGLFFKASDKERVFLGTRNSDLQLAGKVEAVELKQSIFFAVDRWYK